MGREKHKLDIIGARNQLHQYYRCPTLIDGADIEDSTFFLDVMSDLNRYISESGTDQERSYEVSSGRTHATYSLEEVEDLIEAERTQSETDSAIHLLSALDKLNRYGHRDKSPVTVPSETETKPVDASYLEPL